MASPRLNKRDWLRETQWRAMEEYILNTSLHICPHTGKHAWTHTCIWYTHMRMHTRAHTHTKNKHSISFYLYQWTGLDPEWQRTSGSFALWWIFESWPLEMFGEQLLQWPRDFWIGKKKRKTLLMYKTVQRHMWEFAIINISTRSSVIIALEA